MRPGQRIGKYVLGERIAVGGMAEVWAAHVEGPQGFVKPLALKFILESFSGDPELERLFVNEARIAAQLQHANLVTVFDFDKVGAEQERGLAGRYYIAMERIEGSDLRHIATAAQTTGYVFPERLALYLAGEVLKALRYVHERRERSKPLGLVHRDVSPHNVLVSYSGEVKLSDFGIAKARAHSSSIGTATGAKTGAIRGKLSYASPEQLNGEAVDHRTDQFALGVTLWELLSGRRLFEGGDELEIINKVVRCEIPSAINSQSRRAVDPAIENVVRRMLALHREDRYPTTADALSAVLSLPGYNGDGAALGDLVRNLFLPSGDLPVTHPIEAAKVMSAGQPATKTMQPAPAAPPRAATPSRPLRSRPAKKRGGGAPARGPGPAGVSTEDLSHVPRHRGAMIVSGAVILTAISLAIVMTRASRNRSATSAAEPVIAPAPSNAEPPATTAPPVAPPQPPAAPPVAAAPEVVEPEAPAPEENPPAAALSPETSGAKKTPPPEKQRGRETPFREEPEPAEPTKPPADTPTSPPPAASPPQPSRKASPTNGAPILE